MSDVDYKAKFEELQQTANQVALCLKADALALEYTGARMVHVQPTCRNTADNLRSYAQALSSTTP